MKRTHVSRCLSIFDVCRTFSTLIVLYCVVSISAVMLDRVIAIAKPILYRNMVRQRSLKKCFYLLVVLKWNWFKWAGDLCSEYCSSFSFRWRNRCSVRALLCFLAAFSRSCPMCHYGLVLFNNFFFFCHIDHAKSTNFIYSTIKWNMNRVTFKSN